MTPGAAMSASVESQRLRATSKAMREAHQWPHPRLEMWRALAALLDESANAMDEMIRDTQRPSEGVDCPPAIYYGDPHGAAFAAARHPAFALVLEVAHYYDEATTS